MRLLLTRRGTFCQEKNQWTHLVLSLICIIVSSDFHYSAVLRFPHRLQ